MNSRAILLNIRDSYFKVSPCGAQALDHLQFKIV